MRRERPAPAGPRDGREPLPSRAEARRADAVQAGLLASRLLDGNDPGDSPAFAAVRDGLTSLAHLLDDPAPGRGAGQLLLLLLAERETFTLCPAPDADRLRVRDAAAALLHHSLWHTDEPLRLLGAALKAHAEEAHSSSTGRA
ncbi:hypothetical protein AB0M39_41660 [Streptomyces sp. NPDC051907]|uniref:hypothetical protein n=1 Tax=Streptomyces sp. NPDC051907 TaxID=3155284 RepID=UPI003429EC3F